MEHSPPIASPPPPEGHPPVPEPGTRRTFLLFLLLPVVLVALLGTVITFWSLNSLREHNLDRYTAEREDLQILIEAAQLGERLAAMHQLSASGLKGAAAGELDEAAIYRIHSEIVDSLAELGQRTMALTKAPHVVAAAGDDARMMLADFENYRNFMVMATDIAAIDPTTAAGYIDQAQDYFVDFVKRRHAITAQISQAALEHAEAGASAFEQVFRWVLLISGVALVVMLALALVSGRWLSLRLTAVADALRLVAGQTGMPPALPGMERLQRTGFGEFKDMAAAVLAFRKAVLERQLAEAELRKLSLAVEQSPNSIVITDLEGRIEYVNQAFVVATGYGAFEAMGKTPRQLYSGKTSIATDNEMWATLTSGGSWRGELINQGRDGREYIELARVSPVRQAGGRVSHYLLLSEDITQRKALEAELEQHRLHLEELVRERTSSLSEARGRLEKAYEQLKESSEREKQAQEIAHLGYWDWDIGSGELIWSDEIYRIFGWEPQSFCPTYERVLDAMLATDREMVQEAVNQVLANPAAEYNIQHPIFRPDGSRRVVQEIGRVVRDGAGTPLRMVGAVLDITDRVKAQEDLELYRLMIEKTADPVFLIDIEDGFRMAYVNEAAVHHYGATREEILTWRIPDWDPNFSVDDLDAHLADMRANPGLVIETTHRVRGGELVPVEVSLNLITYKGRLCHFGYIKNVTERKEAEQQLRAAKEKAEAADRAKSQFLANMSHEIRTPMNAVINLTRLVLQTELKERQRDYLAKVLRSGENLLGVINDILDFSKIEAGKLTMEAISFDLEELLSDVAAVVAPLVLAREIEFLIDFPRDLPRELKGDAMRLGQVLTNLVSNGIKFTDQGEVILSIELVSRTAEEAVLAFAVRDSGIGMTEAQLQHLFQPFQQADGSITRKYGGTGLGLAISRQLLGLMGSELTVDSVPGRGSTFRFTLRLPVGESAPVAAVVCRQGRELRTLVVDDNATARQILTEMLTSFSLEARAAGDGATALEEMVQAAAEGRPYELVFVDWQMGEMDGMELAQRIRADARLAPKPRLVLVTAYGRDEVKERARQAGFATIMEKPVSPSRLFDYVIGRPAGAASDAVFEEPSQPMAGLAAIRGGHVLLVEDNDINQEIAVELLTGVGLTVAVAANGVEALARLAQERFDLVLMDLQLPEMDGYEATRRIRLQDAHRDLPIVAMTAHAMSGDRERCLRAGMNDHLVKPIDIAALHRALVRWIPSRESAPGPLPAGGRPASDVDVPLPAKLPGIDIDKGLRRSGGNRALYLRLLNRFGTSNAQAAMQLRTALADAQWEEARLLVHAIKGVAGNLGAMALFEAAAGLEPLLTGQNEAAGPASDRFVELLDEVLVGLQPLLAAGVEAPGAEPTGEREEVASAVVLPLLEKLGSLLDRDFGAARNCFEQLKPLLADTLLWVEAERLARALSEYDTDQAVAVIQRLRQELNQGER